ncbi:hypothetical protein GGTG_03726 [Gaeumannomyces tritici R3-111a-1]|uniref:Uncharacterized protein n=1 Tax=Gaeumannomyces tritici (strain R3-111a-1) TaxID=644352 RepID=J3NR21_GAET3|nr:hypothetical protein GGTG_03726 [Gaeumannomyces tritici R3-111a-1]EJT78627.1 hypothetical protein GGTG_03726 [Gaeumannomyces tritici R3-111a-1]
MAERWSRSWSASPAGCRLGNQGKSDARPRGAVGNGWWEHADGNTGLGPTGRCHTSNGMVWSRIDVGGSAASMAPKPMAERPGREGGSAGQGPGAGVTVLRQRSGPARG